MGEIAADPTHPRYQSLLMRHRLETAAAEGLLAGSAMIAHGRGEAFDYLLGEQTIQSAEQATKVALAHLLAAKNPIISLNGNAVALAGKELMEVAQAIGCRVEINIFYRTPERMEGLLKRLNSVKEQNGLEVEILGEHPDARIPGLEGPRAKCCKSGIFDCDVILVPLEDGDRCEALVAMGKTVIVIDLNPLSRSARMGSITIVDELSRVAKNMLEILQSDERVEPQSPPPQWNNEAGLKSSLEHIISHLSERFE